LRAIIPIACFYEFVVTLLGIRATKRMDFNVPVFLVLDVNVVDYKVLIESWVVALEK
jgi:hypothetical protein